MAKVFIEETSLTAIGDAIRAKTGDSALMSPAAMATAIEGITTGGGGGECNLSHIPEEALTITGNCNNRFANNGWNWFLEQCGDKITTKNITDASNMFYSYTLTSIPFDINLNSGSSTVACSYLFYDCENLTRLPYIKGKIGDTNYMFMNLTNLREIPEDWADYIDWSGLHTNTMESMVSTIVNCYSLRKIPANLMSNLWSNCAYYYSIFSSGFNNCYALDEFKGIVPKTGAYTSNTFGTTFSNSTRVKDITFALQEDGTPYEVNWKSQTIDLTTRVGYVAQDRHMTEYNSGITIDKKVTDAASYQALKNDPDWYTLDIAYSRYNHDSAVNTINSLPITTNTGCTIKFKGASGSATDGGAINTLTEEEIAVAAAKGWTVTLT
jgi:hypothetical protein